MTGIAVIPKNATEEFRVTVDSFKGRTLINVRVWFEDGPDKRPGKQGFAIKPALAPAIIEALQSAFVAAGGAK